MLRNSIAAVSFGLALAGGANAAIIDFTDTSVWIDGSSTASVGGATVSLSSTGGMITQTNQAPGPVGPLAGLSDGLGIGDDEISFGRNPIESITVTFSQPVRVSGLFFLDLFQSRTGQDLEDAVATFSGGQVISTNALVTPGDGIGFASSFFAPIITSSITFTAAPGNDNLGRADFALGGIEVQPIPLPASAMLFGSALFGMGLLARRNRAV